MNIKTMAGSIHSNLDVELDKEYSYNELKILFRNIDGFFSIVQDNEKIYTNLYDDIEMKNKQIKLDDLTIAFHPYLKNDLDKIKYKYPIQSLFGFGKSSDNITYKYYPKKDIDLTTEFELSQTNLDNDRLFMLALVNLDGCLLSYASEEIKNDKYLVYNAYLNNRDSFQYASNEIKNDKLFIDKYFSIFCILKYCSDEIKNDKELVIKLLKQSFSVIGDIGPTLINDKEFIFEIFKLDTFDCSIIKYFNNNLKNDKALILKCLEVQKNNILKNTKYYYTTSLNLDDIGNDLRYDRDIIIECLKFDGSELKNIPEDYPLDNELILFGLKSRFTEVECLDDYEDILDCINKSFRRDKEIVIAAIRRHGNNYHYASKRLKNDPEVIIEAINNCWYDTSEYDKKKTYNNEIGKSIIEVDKHIQRILKSTHIRCEQISNAIINKLRKQYI